MTGDRSAQFSLYNLYSKAMYNVSYRILGDEDEACDVLQEAFVSAFENLGSYRWESSFGAWLKRIVINKALNQIKRRSVGLLPWEDHLDDRREEEDDYMDEEELALSVETVKAAIQELPRGFKMVLSLYLIEGYDHREISEILGITESTSKSQYKRAKDKLKRVLKEQVGI